MTFEFAKMNGAGNDFILVDNRAGSIQLTSDQVARLCHRQKGIGADGFVMLIDCESGRADWAWEFYNSDGSTADMCGNAARCFARFVERVTQSPAEIAFETGAGVIRARLEADGVTVGLTEPRDMRLGEQVSTSQGALTVCSLNTGVPHAVIFVPDADKAMVGRLGPEIRYHERFAPKGTNVNFVQLLGPNSIRVRTYERGVENETLACGTGVTASALLSAKLHDFKGPVKVAVQGGDRLEVGFEKESGRFTNVWLKGPAEFVFDGRISL